MKNLLNVALCLRMFFGFCATANAGANFIVQSSSGGHKANRVPTINMCAKRGFGIHSCGENEVPNKSCVFDGTTYYDKCCDKEVYKYSGYAACANLGMKTGDVCGGKYSCVEK